VRGLQSNEFFAITSSDRKELYQLAQQSAVAYLVPIVHKTLTLPEKIYGISAPRNGAGKIETST
jgi:hypothetical protein